MLKARLAHPIAERRRAHRRTRAHARAAAAALAPPAAAPAAVAAPHAAGGEAASADPDVARVQTAGGPLDRASYTCACGYVFSAPVSTSVSCPHCGCFQAW